MFLSVAAKMIVLFILVRAIMPAARRISFEVFAWTDVVFVDVRLYSASDLNAAKAMKD